jgi:hypothetical protein
LTELSGKIEINNTGLDRKIFYTGSKLLQVKEIEMFEISASQKTETAEVLRGASRRETVAASTTLHTELSTFKSSFCNYAAVSEVCTKAYRLL